MKHTYKMIIAIVLLAVAIGAVSIYSFYMLNSSSSKMEKDILAIENSIRKKNWDSAGDNLEKMQKSWSKTKKMWAVMLDHAEIDNIDITLSKLSSYIEMKDLALALAETASLKQYIKHIPEKESANISNIF